MSERVSHVDPLMLSPISLIPSTESAMAMAEIFGIVPGLVLGTLGRLLFVMVVAAIWRRACRAVMLVCAVIYFLAAMCNHFRWLGPASG